MAVVVRNFIRDPLFHFLAIGGVVFVLFSLMGEPKSNESRIIQLTAGEIKAMQRFWEKTHFRLPTETELEGLIQSRIKEEVLSREALDLGISEGDPLIRRRLAQKMEFLSEGLIDPGEPTDTELRAYVKTNPDQFQVPAQISFEHVYLNPKRHGKNLEQNARALLISMKKSHSTTKGRIAGDPILLNSHFDHITPTSLAGFFGEEFAKEILKLPLGEWQGPVSSAYGLHLVYVYERTEALMPEFTNIRDKVREALLEKRRRDATQSLYESLQKRYHIEVKRPMSRSSFGPSQRQ